MKIQLDTTNKTITIEEDVNLHDFYESLNSILPDGKWREFTLKVSKITEWIDPTVIRPQQPNPYGPVITPNPYDNNVWCSTDTGIFNFKYEA